MIVLFNEQDLASFGTYMLSKERRRPYLESDLPTEKIEELLRTVTNYDIESWIKLSQAPKEVPMPEASEPQDTEGQTESIEE